MMKMEKYINGYMITDRDDLMKLLVWNIIDDDQFENYESEIKQADSNALGEYVFFYNTLENDFYLLTDMITSDGITFFRIDKNKDCALFFDYENWLAHASEMTIYLDGVKFKVNYCKAANMFEVLDDEIWEYENAILSVLNESLKPLDDLDNINMMEFDNVNHIETHEMITAFQDRYEYYLI